MNKVMAAVAASACAVSLTGLAVAAENASVERPAAEAVILEEEEEDAPPFEAGVDLDCFTAYVWRNTVQTDKPVFQPCVWADFTALEPFWFGFSYWQNWDLSSDRKDVFRRRLNESDYNVHAGATAWESEDGDLSVAFEAGHDWYTYHMDRDRQSPSTRELYLKGTFANPLVNVYGLCTWMYDDVGEYDSGFYYEIGFSREIELTDSLTLGADWNVGLADDDYVSFLIDDVGGGFVGTTFKAYLSWAVTDWLSLVGTIAYTGILDEDARRYYNGEDKDLKDTLWGGLSAKFSF